jgi:transketolase
MALRAMPNLVLLRPCDANETAAAWKWTMTHKSGPVALVLSRQKLPVIDRSTHAAAAELAKGAYVLADAVGGKPDAILIATGAEVHAALAAREMLSKDGTQVRVVSMPSWEIFAQQEAAYRDSVLPPAIRARVSVEAGVTLGWERWIGDHGVAIGIDRFGASAPGDVNLEKLGFAPRDIVAAVHRVLTKK